MKENTLSRLLYSEFNVTLTQRHVSMLDRYMREFESRPGHAETFGSALLGVYKAHFLQKDALELFDIFGIDYAHFKRVAHSADEVDTTRKVTSEPYNILVIWLVHLFEVSRLSNKSKVISKTCLLKMMQYRFFTSVVNYNFPHGAHEGTMQYTIDNLSNKFAIRNEGSWKKLIESRVEDILDRRGIHFETIELFGPDEKILYAISDIQTRIRKQLVLVIQLYYTNKEKGLSVSSVNIVEDINGDKMLRVLESSMDTMIGSVTNSATNLTEFLDYEYIKIAVGLSNDLTEDIFIKFLTKFSILAEVQMKKGDGEKTKGSRNSPIFVGYAILLSTILQKTYRLCMLDKDVDLGSKVSILTKTRNIYRSSRITDKDIIAIKDSVAYFVNKYSNSKRSMTNSSIRITFIVYIILLSFKYIK